MSSADTRLMASEPGLDMSPRAGVGAGYRLAVVAFVLTRLWLLFVFQPQVSDRPVYFEYAIRGVDLGQVPYGDFDVEYPPVAYWAIAVPRWLASDRLSPDGPPSHEELARRFPTYSLGFRLEMWLFDIVAFACFVNVARRWHPERAAAAAWGYVLTSTILGHVLYDRLDVGLSAFLLSWLAARTAAAETRRLDWELGSYVLLGLGIAYKAVGIVALPFVLLADTLATSGSVTRRWGLSATRLAVTAVSVSLPFAVHFASAGTDVLGLLRYHGERGIQVESTYATLLYAASSFGLPLGVSVDHGSANLVSSLSPSLTRVAPWILVVALSALGIWALSLGRRFRPDTASRAGLIAILLVLVFSKVLSTQYFVFATPVVLLLSTALRDRRAYVGVVVTCVVMTTLTTLVFPYLYGLSGGTRVLVPDLHWLPVGLLLLRNVMFVGVVGLLVALLRQGVAATPEVTK